MAKTNSQSGYALISVLAVMLILAVVALAAAPQLAQQNRRQREEDAIERGTEVAEAIREYRRLTGVLPGSLEDLSKGITPPGRIKKIYLLRRFALHDPLSSTGEWRTLKTADPEFTAFQQGVIKYAEGLPTSSDPNWQLPAPILGLGKGNDADEKDEAPGGEESGANVTGPFVGVVSRSRRASVLTFYGMERHDRWVFTPYYR